MKLALVCSGKYKNRLV